MTTLTGLLVENAKSAALIRKTLDLDFAEYNWKVTWTTAKTAHKGRKLARQVPPFDFAIVDHALGEGQPDGSVVVRDLRAHSEDTFILVINSYPGGDLRYIAQAEESGANHAMPKAELLNPDAEWSFRRLVKKVLSTIKDLMTGAPEKYETLFHQLYETMLAEPHVGLLAAELLDCIRRATRRGA